MPCTPSTRTGASPWRRRWPSCSSPGGCCSAGASSSAGRHLRKRPVPGRGSARLTYCPSDNIQRIGEERRMSTTYEYPRPALTVDCVVFGFDGAGLKLLLIERGLEPFKG